MIEYRDGELRFDGHSIRSLAEGRSTPFYLFSERAIRASYSTLVGAFGGLEAGCQIDYSLKTNYEPGLLGLIAELGAGAMVSCGWELELALQTGFRAERIGFQGPCKTGEELDAAISAGVGLIHLGSVDEVESIERLAVARRQDLSTAD